MHRLTKSYTPSTSGKRHKYLDSDWIKNSKKYLPKNDKIVEKEWALCMKMYRTIPKNRNSYGLVHGDLHTGNFFITPKYKITSFDFDDACYNYFIYDIAICLMRYYTYRKTANKTCNFKYRQFFSAFNSGYQSENIIEQNSWKLIPDILRLRNIEMYSWYHKMFDMKNLSSENAEHLTNMYEKILKYQRFQ